jgi:hypothetical protein
MADASPSPVPDRILALIQGTTEVPRSIAKLIDTVREQLGLFLEPYHIRRRGQAEADVVVTEAKTKADIAVIRLENKLAIRDIEDRAEERVRRQEAKRQENLEAITAQAAREIPESVSDQPVDEDWVAQFLNNCQDISNKQMQLLWARLLAREVAKPGSYSLRTMTVVRNLSKTDADLFTRFCSMVWELSGALNALTPDIKKLKALPGIQLEFTDFVRLDALGLIRFDALGGFAMEFRPERPPNCAQPHQIHSLWHYYGQSHLLSKPIQGDPPEFLSIDMGKAMLTDIGLELAPTSGSTPNEAYRQLMVSELRQRGCEVVET